MELVVTKSFAGAVILNRCPTQLNAFVPLMREFY